MFYSDLSIQNFIPVNHSYYKIKDYRDQSNNCGKNKQENVCLKHVPTQFNLQLIKHNFQSTGRQGNEHYDLIVKISNKKCHFKRTI